MIDEGILIPLLRVSSLTNVFDWPVFVKAL